MTQVSTLSQADGAGSAVRTGFNAIIEAIASMNSGSSEPNDNSTRAMSLWYDTTNGVIKLRDPTDTDWIDIANVLTSPFRIQWLSEGVEVLTASVADFTDSLSIDVSGGVGELSLGSDVSTGVPARINLIGHDSLGNDTIYGQLRSNITSNTNTSEAAELIFAAMRAGSLTDKITIADAITIAGTFNATTLQQGGTAVQTLINNSIDSLDSTDFTSSPNPFVLTQGMSGFARRFTGGTPINVSVPVLTKDSVIVIDNDSGSATLTFVASGVTFQNGVTLAAGKSATLRWLQTNKVRILGENT